jgi:hypothetical protein
MNPRLIASGFLVVGLLLAGCATPASAPRAAAPAAATAPSAAATGVAATPTVRPEFPGFKLVVRKGQELYCQTRSPTGSRARLVEMCYTRDEMQKMADNKTDFFKQAIEGSSHDTLRMDSPN